MLTDIYNCNEYNETTNACTTCDDFSMINGDVCDPQTTANCKTYDLTNKLECATCRMGYLFDSTAKTCTLRTMTGCDVFDVTSLEVSICTHCLDGYFLKSDGTSCDLQNVAHCKVYNELVCTTCFAGYYFATPDCVA